MYVQQEDSSEKTLLQEISPGRFAGKVKAVSCSPLHVMAVFEDRMEERESNGEEVDPDEEIVGSEKEIQANERHLLECKVMHYM